MVGCTLTGVVEHGKGWGQGLGVRTANLRVDGAESDVLVDGVYAVEVSVGEAQMDGAMSIGTRPTFGGEDRAVEVHMFDFVGDVYGERMDVRVVGRLRKQVKFETVEDLKRQMAEDLSAARTMLMVVRRRSEQRSEER